ncbi:GNAT family N-acetyltransferase [Salipaludibacillus neizhouensis]|uniref:GNAT family N-acetyltransferase n=1 Tax=Salipaludibacillus neizhouensis TaxID=885475 RepID=A0A3A9JW20_9BACI|nr:GNAT family N-acetyltransferase [Salipaludibacillus neizhouensis]RKL64667.1 GNAT family N-acetyltransferase [Salipaludibacillus neizhouensis]
MTERIELMTFDKLEQSIELYMKVFNSEPWDETWSYEIAKERLFDLINTPKFFGYSLYIEDKLVGFIAGNNKKSHQGLTYYLAELCVSNEIQGKGYGTKLLQLLETELKNRDTKSLYLLTSNGGLAEAFYKKNGYQINNNRIVIKKNL